MSNIYLEKAASMLVNIGRAAEAIKATARTAAGKEYKPLLAKTKALSNNIAKHQNENAVLGKATAAYDPSKFKSQAQFDLASNSVNGPRMSANSRMINNRKQILERVGPLKDQAQLNMHKAQLKVGGGVAAVGLAGSALSSGKNQQNSPQNYQY